MGGRREPLSRMRRSSAFGRRCRTLAWSISVSIGVTGCLSFPKSEYPSDWALPLKGDSSACPKLSGTYWDWPERPALIRPEPVLGGFSLATVLLENRLDIEPDYYDYDKFRLETTSDGMLRVDILDRQTEAVVLSKSLHVGKDLLPGVARSSSARSPTPTVRRSL